jgi:catechol 2,3-dioxygenase-like lactoylglutathione lyase family enzyme
MASLPLDHLTILSRDADAAARFYGLVLPLLGFAQKKADIWFNDHGLYLQFRAAEPDTADYGRYAPGLNHLGFRAQDAASVEAIKAAMDQAGYEARLQRFGDGVTALFIPDPDGLRLEVSYYPPGIDPVD